MSSKPTAKRALLHPLSRSSFVKVGKYFEANKNTLTGKTRAEIMAAVFQDLSVKISSAQVTSILSDFGIELLITVKRGPQPGSVGTDRARVVAKCLRDLMLSLGQQVPSDLSSICHGKAVKSGD